MDKVWIVFKGAFSDRDVCGVFSTKEKAEEYANHLGSYEVEMIEYEVDSESVKDGLYEYCVYIGGKTEAKTELYNGYAPVSLDQVMFLNDDRFVFVIKARDSRHAVKIASERLFYIRANPFLFPRINERCVLNSGFTRLGYPVYDFNTMQIVLEKGQALTKK